MSKPFRTPKTETNLIKNVVFQYNELIELTSVSELIDIIMFRNVWFRALWSSLLVEILPFSKSFLIIERSMSLRTTFLALSATTENTLSPRLWFFNWLINEIADLLHSSVIESSEVSVMPLTDGLGGADSMSPPLALVGVRPDFLRDLEPRVGVRSASDSSSPDPTGELDLEAVPLPLRPLVSVS